MNMLLSRPHRVSCKLLQVCGPLVIKFNQDHRTLHAVIKHAIRLRATDRDSSAVLVELRQLLEPRPGEARL
jgi:hypothetical protein